MTGQGARRAAITRIGLIGLLGGLAACGPGVMAEGGVGGRCRIAIDKKVSYAAELGGRLETGPLQRFEGQAGYRQLLEVKTRYDTLQRDYAQMSRQLCEDSAKRVIDPAEYTRRRACIDRFYMALRGLQITERDPKALAFGIEGRTSFLREILDCPAAPARRPEGPELELTAFLVCQRRRPGGGYEDVPRCLTAELTAGDRAKLGFEVSRPARIYVLGYNSTGQFQALFPAPGVDNQVAAGRPQFIPPGERWLELDDVGGVTEIVQIVASMEPVAQLEALRGQSEPPQGGRLGELGRAARAWVEPAVTRGWRQEGPPIQLTGPGAPAASTVPLVTRRRGIAAAELRVVHR